MRASLLLAFALGCGGKSTEPPTIEFDAGADSDSDSDGDTDADTDTGTSTDTDTGTGTGDACQPDANEPNDSIEAATVVADGTSVDDLTICPGDEDFFAVDLAVGEQVVFDVLFSHFDTRDIDMELLGPDGTPVWESVSGDDDEHIAFWPWADLGGGQFVLVVYGWEDPRAGIEFEGNSYDLRVAVNGEVACNPDVAEDDDTPATAGDAPPSDRGGLYGVCPGDADHFAIDADAGQRILAFASYFSPWGHVDAEILDPDGVTVLDAAFDYDPARGTQGRELARWDALVDGTYVVRISGTDVTNDYFFVAFLQDAPLCAIDDAYEENDYADWSVALPTGRSDGLSVCWGDDDWYAIDATEGQSIGIDVLFTHDAEADIDVVLYDPNGDEVERSESGDDDERIDHVAAETGEYRFFVFGWRGSENSYSLDLTVE